MSRTGPATGEEAACPDWLPAWGDMVADALGLNAWHIDYAFVDEPPTLSDGTGRTAIVDPRWSDLHATITFYRPDVAEDTMQARHTVTHEMLHIAMEPIGTWVEGYLNIHAGGSARRRRNAMFDYGKHEEHVVVRLARRLTLIITQWDGTEEYDMRPLAEASEEATEEASEEAPADD
jgi:hypothetical protein